MSVARITPEAELMPANWFQANWYAVCLSSQEIFGRGLASHLIKKNTQPSFEDIRGTFAVQNLLGLFAMGMIVFAARPVAGWYGQAQLQVLLTAAAVACYGYALRGVPLALLERNFDYFRVSIIEILENIFFYTVAIPLAWLGHVEAGLASAIVLRSWGPTLLVFVLQPVRPAFWIGWKDLASVADFGFSVAAGSLVNIAVYSVPAFLVGKLSGMKELGQAQMAFSLYGNLLFVTAAVVRLNLSAYSRLIEHAAEFSTTVNQQLQILSAAMVPLIVLFAGAAPVWTSFIFGQKWPGLPRLLLIQAPGYMLAAVSWGVLNPALLVSGKHRRVLIWLGGFFISYSTLTRLLSPAWGAAGVAIAFSSTEIIFHPWLFSMYGWERLEYRKFFPEIFLGTAFTGLLWTCAQRSRWAAFLFGVFYLILWCTRNRRILTSVRKDFGFERSHSLQDLILPANR